MSLAAHDRERAVVGREVHEQPVGGRSPRGCRRPASTALTRLNVARSTMPGVDAGGLARPLVLLDDVAPRDARRRTRGRRRERHAGRVATPARPRCGTAPLFRTCQRISWSRSSAARGTFSNRRSDTFATLSGSDQRDAPRTRRRADRARGVSAGHDGSRSGCSARSAPARPRRPGSGSVA